MLPTACELQAMSVVDQRGDSVWFLAKQFYNFCFRKEPSILEQMAPCRWNPQWGTKQLESTKTWNKGQLGHIPWLERLLLQPWQHRNDFHNLTPADDVRPFPHQKWGLKIHTINFLDFSVEEWQLFLGIITLEKQEGIFATWFEPWNTPSCYLSAFIQRLGSRLRSEHQITNNQTSFSYLKPLETTP